MPFRLADRCPRLALARDQRVAELHQESLERRRLMWRVQKAERLVAHRDLQAARALAKPSNGYYAKRRRMLEAARRELLRAQDRARAKGVRV